MIDNKFSISIILPVFNGGHLFCKCIESICEQELKNIECVLITDDESNIKTAMKILSKREDIRIVDVNINKTDSGTCRNIGLKKSSGKYVFFVDEDDEIYSTKTLKCLYKTAEENFVNVCGGSLIYIDIYGQEIKGKYKRQKFNKEGFCDFSDYQKCNGFQRFLYKREYLKDKHITFPALSRFQDSVFLVRCLSTAKRFYSVKDNIYKYRKYKNNILSYYQVKDHMVGCVEILNISRVNGYYCLGNEMLSTIMYLLNKYKTIPEISGYYSFSFFLVVISTLGLPRYPYIGKLIAFAFKICYLKIYRNFIGV